MSIIDALILLSRAKLAHVVTTNGTQKEEAVLDAMVRFIDSKEKVHLIPIEISEERLRQGIEELKSISKTKDKKEELWKR